MTPSPESPPDPRNDDTPQAAAPGPRTSGIAEARAWLMAETTLVLPRWMLVAAGAAALLLALVALD